MVDLEREFTIQSYRHHLGEMSRELLEMQFLKLLEEYLNLCDELNYDDEEGWDDGD